jgi:hypothetical protein
MEYETFADVADDLLRFIDEVENARGLHSTLLIPSDFVVHSFRPPMEEAMSRLWSQLG